MLIYEYRLAGINAHWFRLVRFPNRILLLLYRLSFVLCLAYRSVISIALPVHNYASWSRIVSSGLDFAFVGYKLFLVLYLPTVLICSYITWIILSSIFERDDRINDDCSRFKAPAMFWYLFWAAMFLYEPQQRGKTVATTS